MVDSDGRSDASSTDPISDPAWFPRRDQHGGAPLVCGHRGSSATHPENTVAAAQGAVDAGATWIEFDVRPCADDLVIHHDPVTRDRTRVATATHRELDVHADAPIPAFAEFVTACGPLGLDIELKTDGIDMPVERFVELVGEQIARHVASANSVIVTSFDQNALDTFRARHPEIATGVLFHDKTGGWAIGRAQAHGHDAIVPWFRLVDRRMVDAAHEAGLGVATWTVNKERHIRSMVRAGVDMIIGDDPADIVAIVADAIA
ncbi:MAG: glycerophosphodiester phosphodiesterase [Actinomycetota bacterium]